MKSEKRNLTIQELATIVGVSTSALRAWERRYSIFSPERTQGGHRLYTQEDLKLFWFVSHLRGQGQDLKQIANLGREELLRQATQFFDLSAPEKKENVSLSQGSLEEKKLPNPFQGILDALKADNVEMAIRALEQVYALADNALVFADSALELMMEVGEHWHRGEITVAAEHALTARLKHMLLGLFYLNNFEGTAGTPEAPLAVCATLPHELHELGLLRVALYMRSWGYRVTYLGANTPVVDLEEYCMRRQPALVILSCAMSLSPQSLLESLQKLSLLVGPHAPVVCGGSGIRSLNQGHVEVGDVILLKSMFELETIASECKKALHLSSNERCLFLKTRLAR
ncbi:MAG: hypothetical protein RIR26_433 [Pseudomonadota bacterium]